MAVTYGTQSTKVLSVPATPSPGFVDGTVRCFAETVTFATQTTGDTIVVARIPKGAVFLYGVLNNDTSTGSATVAIGITGTTGKYRAALAKTTVVPEVYGVATTMSTADTLERTVFITIAAASLPTSGVLTNQMYYAHN